MTKSAIKITNVTARDIRFPTSNNLAGSDAMNPNPDYSLVYVELETDQANLAGYGMTFTLGQGNELCLQGVNALKNLVIGRTLEDIVADMAGFWRSLTYAKQLRWIGPEKGVIHMATAALVNAVWDLYARAENKPLWKLLADMSPEQLIACVDFTYINDYLSPVEALNILKEKQASRAAREQQILAEGFPAYITSIGWLGYEDDKVVQLCQEAMRQGWRCMKMKVGACLEDDVRRAKIIRDTIGWDCKLMMDANQVWNVDQAIDWIKQLAPYQPWWIEEPTSPDDVLGFAKISQAVAPIKLATGEQCQNRIMFKQFFQMHALQICQADACRLGGVNEAIAVMLMAAKANIPICQHSGGVGLSEFHQHLSIFDFIAISGSLENRMLEYVSELHQHFVEPVQMKNGRYMPPLAPGASIEMFAESLQQYVYANHENEEAK